MRVRARGNGDGEVGGWEPTSQARAGAELK